MPRIAVIYYSSTGANHTIAEAFVEGADDAGAEVRLRRAGELAPQAVIDGNAAWAAHQKATQHIEVATPDDLAWSDGFVLGAPTRFGQPASQIKQFIDTTSGPWTAGQLANKPAALFTSTTERHGGQEATLLSLAHTLFHWGSIIVPTGYVDYGLSHAAGGNPYGVSAITGDGAPDEHVLALARFQGKRVAELADALKPAETAEVEEPALV